MNPLHIERYLTVSEAAEKLNMTKEEVKELVNQGFIKPHKAHPDDVRYLIPMSEVKKLLNREYH